jgi:hypothetical protein
MKDPADDRATLLRDRMDRLADSVPAGGGTDGAQLYRRSLQRRRRRIAATMVATAAVTATVLVGGAIWLPGVDDDGGPGHREARPPVAGQGNTKADSDAGSADRARVLAGVDDPGGRTAGQTVEVSQAEAERRCTTVWHQLWGPSAVAVQLSGDSGPWFEGDAVEIANAQQFDYSPFDASGTDGRCVIPQAGLEDAVGTVPLPVPAADDADGVRAACGQYLGWDFSDWQVVVADGAEGRLAAMLRSPDGYMSRCQLDSWYLDGRGAVDNDKVFADPHAGFVPFVEITAPEKFQDEAETFGAYRIDPSFLLGCQHGGPGQWEADCLGAGFVAGSDPIERIVITDVTGAEHEIPVVDGWLAFAGTVINQADSQRAPGELHFTVYGTDGTVLAEYDEDA